MIIKNALYDIILLKSYTTLYYFLRLSYISLFVWGKGERLIIYYSIRKNMNEREKQAYLLGYMKCINEIMTQSHTEVNSEIMAKFSANLLLEMAHDLEIAIPPSEMTREATKLYNQMGDIITKWEYR